MILSSTKIEMIIVFFLIFLLYVLVRNIKTRQRKRWIHEYRVAFHDIFLRELSIKSTLEGLLIQYEEDKRVREAIMAALAYLECSVLRDYQSALLLLDDVFHDEEVRKMHATSIQIIKKQRVAMIPVRKEQSKK